LNTVPKLHQLSTGDFITKICKLTKTSVKPAKKMKLNANFICQRNSPQKITFQAQQKNDGL
jgi:hypothetical protein